MISYQVNNLSFSYQNHPVLADLNMTIQKGRLHALVGANGAGKSTLIKLLAGLIQPDQGSIDFEAQHFTAFSDRERARKIAYMAQESTVPGAFTAGEVVAMGRYAHQKTPQAAFNDAAVRAAMTGTQTLELYHEKIGELSGGEKSRVNLARALAQGTQVLLLDEVTAALDIAHQLAVMENLRDWLDEEKTVIMVLHDINLAVRYADEIWMLADGRVYAHGRPEELLTRQNIEHVYEVDCLIDWNAVTDTPMVIPIHHHRHTMEELNVHVVCGGGTGAQLLSVLYSWEVTVSAGILNQGDFDQQTARRLGMELYAKEPFSLIEETDVRGVLEQLQGIDAVLVTNVPIGSGNAENMDFIHWAADRGVPVFYCPWQTEEQYVHRDFRAEWEHALERTMLCQTKNELKRQLEALRTEPHPSSAKVIQAVAPYRSQRERKSKCKLEKPAETI